MIHFLQPFAYDRNIGGQYNKAIRPLSGWICITDQDTLKFNGFAERLKEITDKADKSQVITCMVNRLRKDNLNVVHELYDESDISIHKKKFDELWGLWETTLQRTKMPIAGVCMVFHKSVWNKVKFRENESNFDNHFTTDVKQAGFTTHVAKGLYIFHLYKWN